MNDQELLSAIQEAFRQQPQLVPDFAAEKIEPDPPEEDAPIWIEEAARIVLDRNPYVDDSQIRIGVRGRVVRLTGAVRGPAERDMA